MILLKSPKTLENQGFFTGNFQHFTLESAVEYKWELINRFFHIKTHSFLTASFQHFNRQNVENLHILDFLHQLIDLVFVIFDRSDINLDVVDRGDDGGVITLEDLADVLE